MVRPRTIDREKLLDVAEVILTEQGAIGLSFGAIASASGLSKATIQSVFGTREALIEALLNRWIHQENARYTEIAGPNPSAQERMLAHVKSTAEEMDADMRRVATILAAMAGSERQMKRAVQWYVTRVGSLEANTPAEQRLRAAFLATEGAFFMRYFIGYEIPDHVWDSIFLDIKQLIHKSI